MSVITRCNIECRLLSIHVQIDRSRNEGFILDYLSIYQSIYLSHYLSITLSIYQSIHLSLYHSINLSIYLSITLSIFQSIYLSITLSLYIFSLYIYICVILIPYQMCPPSDAYVVDLRAKTSRGRPHPSPHRKHSLSTVKKPQNAPKRTETFVIHPPSKHNRSWIEWCITCIYILVY